MIALLGAIPAKVWLGLTLAVALGLGAWDLHHRWYGSGYAAAKAKMLPTIAALEMEAKEAQVANASADSVIASLRSSQAACEYGRITERDAQTKVLANRAAQATALKRSADAAQAKLSDLLANRCRDWAAQPACTQ